MSKEHAKEFLKKISMDKAIAEKFKEAFRAALVKAGNGAGFKFTREELDAALTEIKAEIPEKELKGISGGGVIDPGGPICRPLCNPNCFPN